MDASVDRDLANTCLLLPRFSCGVRNLTSVLLGMLPIAISWKENKLKSGDYLFTGKGR